MLNKFIWFSGIESDVKNIPLLDRNDERIQNALETFIDQTCDICHIKLDSLSLARTHYIVEHKKPLGYFKCCKSKHYCETNLIDHLNWHVNPNIFTCVKKKDVKFGILLIKISRTFFPFTDAAYAETEPLIVEE